MVYEKPTAILAWLLEGEAFRELLVPWEAPVRLARDRWQIELPAESKGTVARSGVIAERQLRPKSGATAARDDRNRDATRAGGVVGRELLSDSSDRTTALGQGNAGGHDPTRWGARRIQTAALISRRGHAARVGDPIATTVRIEVRIE